MNIYLHVFVDMFSVILGKYLAMKLLDHVVNIVKLYNKLPNYFPKLCYFALPLNNAWKFQVLHNLSTLGIVISFHFSHLNQCIVVFHCGFNLHFPDDVKPVGVPVGHLNIFFCKVSFQIFYLL